MEDQINEQEVYNLCAYMIKIQHSRGQNPIDKNGKPHTLESLFQETMTTFKSEKFKRRQLESIEDN